MKKKKRRLSRLARRALPLLCILLLLSILLYGLWMERRRTRELERQAENASVSVKPQTISWNGQTYALKSGLETYLIIGIDDNGTDTDESYNHQSQADFLTLVIADKANKSCRLLQLNRDTICDVQALGLDGRVVGNHREQLALAHTYGSGRTDSCRNTVKAVENLLYGIQVDSYIRLRISSIPKLNDAVDGVEVTLAEDFSRFDKAMTEGTTLTLRGEQAELFVRARQGMEEPTNLARMERQRRYMTGWVKAARQKLGDSNNGYEVMKPVANELYSELTLYQISQLADTMLQYALEDIQTIPGEAVMGERFMEFYPDEAALQQQVIDLFYEPFHKGEG